ncbi:AAA family ATPase [Plebeiibacterium sediminum]|uniref:MoxR family ATPase n=1 Tax=Plebeiibacterium sediminum TaxID=2992112 RepID=A0AAE3M1E6_9BACT|nr:MoxR family ATPase [Plebeiobacterium sediminum]MCW3784975.1 MoxR family ATPase [Plebeiobacterium sediminum]
MENNTPFESRLNLDNLNKAVYQIKNEITKVIVGQEKIIDLMLTALLANGHVLLEGVPGIAKTMLSKLLAKTISTDFSRIQFTPDLMPSDVLGTTIYNSGTSMFEFKQGPIFSNLVLIDEINRSPAKTQSALFEVMEERQVTIDGECREMQPPFIVFATQNPVEHEGTYRLPEAQLDRFLFKIELDYPNLEEEIQIITNAQTRKAQKELELINAVIKAEEIVKYQSLVKEVIVEQDLIRYIAQVVEKTRKSNSIFLGGSPRASLAILNASKAFAAIEGRDFVTPEDIKFVLTPVLIHRVILTPEKEMEGVTTQQVIQQIIDSVEIPR